MDLDYKYKSLETNNNYYDYYDYKNNNEIIKKNNYNDLLDEFNKI